jgi:hypothetical protein
MKTVMLVFAGLLLAMGFRPPSAAALTPFSKAFEEKYANGHPHEAFRTAYKKTRCNVCHVKGKPKTVCNAYGNELAKLIEGNAEERIKHARQQGKHAEVERQILQELDAAFDRVAKLKSRPDDATSPTFGDLIKNGQLPVAGE